MSQSQDMIVSYTAAVLFDGERDRILAALAAQLVPFKEAGWKFTNRDGSEELPHHRTICLGKLPDEYLPLLGHVKTLIVTGLGRSDLAVACLVEDSLPSLARDAGPAHITVCIEPTKGQPFHSNKITEWTPLEELGLEPFKLLAEVREVLKPRR